MIFKQMNKIAIKFVHVKYQINQILCIANFPKHIQLYLFRQSASAFMIKNGHEIHYNPEKRNYKKLLNSLNFTQTKEEDRDLSQTKPIKSKKSLVMPQIFEYKRSPSVVYNERYSSIQSKKNKILKQYFYQYQSSKQMKTLSIKQQQDSETGKKSIHISTEEIKLQNPSLRISSKEEHLEKNRSQYRLKNTGLFTKDHDYEWCKKKKRRGLLRKNSPNSPQKSLDQTVQTKVRRDSKINSFLNHKELVVKSYRKRNRHSALANVYMGVVPESYTSNSLQKQNYYLLERLLSIKPSYDLRRQNTQKLFRTHQKTLRNLSKVTHYQKIKNAK